MVKSLEKKEAKFVGLYKAVDVFSNMKQRRYPLK